MLDIMEQFPDAAKVVREYYLDKMLLSLDESNLPEGFKEHVRSQGIDNQKIAKMLEVSPRGLLDVFDDNFIFIEVSVLDGEGGFSWRINGSERSDIYPNRKEAETDAVKEAFKLLNDKLCQTK